MQIVANYWSFSAALEIAIYIEDRRGKMLFCKLWNKLNPPGPESTINFTFSYRDFHTAIFFGRLTDTQTQVHIALLVIAAFLCFSNTTLI